ncbi:ATP-dependent zinc metalloprotease FtsH [Candidatus Phytoplasma solani]|uniref:ATP-dependent zinc metalloprotease FtsH n=1 Tax=Candidatus Phytoplasma solani TaxID=69896 RepID=UPI0032DA7EE7
MSIKKITRILKRPMFFLILTCVFFLGYFLFVEFRQQWEDKDGRCNHNELIQKIKDAPSKESNRPEALESIKIFELGGSIMRTEHMNKIIVTTKGGDVYYTTVNSTLFFTTISHALSEKEIGQEKANLISTLNNKEIFVIKPFSFVASPFLGIISSVTSIWWIMYLYQMRKTGAQKNNTLEHVDKQKTITFEDVAGSVEEKEELKELVDFLKQPKKYLHIGAKIPKGVLLSGPPGTGKTLLAKAVAGEAQVPFYFASGSEFVEMYVGVGAARIRNLFKAAINNAPCILFIDEIDSLGGKRGDNSSGGSSEKDQTLNQLLTEMDGFNPSLGVVVIAATNRTDILDFALLRPGRFDRQIIVDLPDVKAREAILKIHARNKKIDPEVNFHQLAKQSQGMSGAQLGAVLNEASILTVRNSKDLITMIELEEAIDRVWFGPAKKSRKYTEEEKRETAYHEAGHAVISLKLKDAPKIQKITIVPRGNAGGYVLFMQEKELFFSSKKILQAFIVCSLGGRAAEEMIFGNDNISDGCYQDFKDSTKYARLMVTKYGMSDVGLMQDSEFTDKKEIHEAMKKIIDSSFKQAQTIIKENKDLLDKIANILLAQETITREEIKTLV